MLGWGLPHFCVIEIKISKYLVSLPKNAALHFLGFCQLAQVKPGMQGVAVLGIQVGCKPQYVIFAKACNGGAAQFNCKR